MFDLHFRPPHTVIFVKYDKFTFKKAQHQYKHYILYFIAMHNFSEIPYLSLLLLLLLFLHIRWLLLIVWCCTTAPITLQEYFTKGSVMFECF